MHYEKTTATFELRYTADNQFFVGVWFIALGIATLVIPGILLQSAAFIVVAVVSSIVGLAVSLTRPEIHTIISRADSAIIIESTRYIGRSVSRSEIAFADVDAVELAAFRYGAKKSNTGRVLYLHTKNGGRFKIAAQQDSNLPLTKTPVSETDITSLAQDLAEFLAIPLNQDNKWRVFDT